MDRNNVTSRQPTRPGTSNTDALFGALSALGTGWHSRKAIAARLGKSELNPFDKAALQLLVEQGRIEVQQTPTVKPTTSRLEYRVTPEGMP